MTTTAILLTTASVTFAVCIVLVLIGLCATNDSANVDFLNNLDKIDEEDKHQDH